MPTLKVDDAEYEIDDIAQAISRIFEAYLEFVREYTELKEMERNKFKHCKTLKQLCRVANRCFELQRKYSNYAWKHDHTNNLSFRDLFPWNDVEYADGFPTFGGPDVEGPDIYSWDKESYLQIDPDGWVLIDREE